MPSARSGKLLRKRAFCNPAKTNTASTTPTIEPLPPKIETPPSRRLFRAGTDDSGGGSRRILESAAGFLAEQPVCTRWQDAMAELLEERVPDGGPPSLPEIFRLD